MACRCGSRRLARGSQGRHAYTPWCADTEVTVANRKAQDPRPAPPIVVYAPLGELKIYEISEAELEKLEAGPPGQLHLNFALAMLPAALTILITLQSTTILSNRVYLGYLVTFRMLSVQGVISLMRWWVSNRSYGKLIREIKARMPARPPIIAEQITMPGVLIERETPRVGEDDKT
jgi:hypothetical protein